MSFILLLLLSPVCVRVQRPAQLHVAMWSGWPACPRERSHCQQHPPDHQVPVTVLDKQQFSLTCVFLRLSTHQFALDFPPILLFRLFRSCNRSLEAEDPEEASGSPSSTGPSPASRNNSFRERCRNQSVTLFFFI